MRRETLTPRRISGRMVRMKRKINKFGGPWCIGCSSKDGCTPEQPNCDSPKGTCGTCAWSVGFERTTTGRFKKYTVAHCSAEVEWPPLPFFLVERLPQKGGYGTLETCWNGRAVDPKDGVGCPCWKSQDLLRGVKV
jgi:hypothetical protein